MSKQEDFRFRYAPQKGTEDAYLIAYLMKHGLSERRDEIILPALRAFWLPFALKAGNLNKEIVKKSGLKEVSNLAYQIDVLRHDLRLPIPPSILQKGGEIGEHSSKKIADKPVADIDPEDTDKITYSQKSDMLIKFGGL